ncbi:hypothetical protein [Kangiella shandongensis]|uniref:hypothetical protein n=1 Tax=Kangiella shandongensis TaxID=2763258 RepID=UPI001CBDA3F5|nr:hypothetical protein [Kangiella shandongensis]
MKKGIGLLIILVIISIFFIWGGLEDGTHNYKQTISNSAELVSKTSKKIVRQKEARSKNSEATSSKNEYFIAGNRYKISDSCSFDIASYLYQYIEADLKGRVWLEKRGYTLFYSGFNFRDYQDLNNEDLKILVESNDVVAMWQLADNMFYEDEDAAKNILENMLVQTGNFTALNTIINTSPYTEKPDMKPLVESYEEWLTWLALNKKLNGLFVFAFDDQYKLIQAEHELLADKKLESINQRRKRLGLDSLPNDPLPKHLQDEVDKFYIFVKSQKDKGVTNKLTCNS